ncbi:hypothetical protein [Paracoccus siganidrum]|nr:hypothetical protein [Paracoccus siganidrum]
MNRLFETKGQMVTMVRRTAPSFGSSDLGVQIREGLDAVNLPSR